MKFSLLTILSAVCFNCVYSQNTNSPYSILGIGDIDNNFYNRTSGMANTGLAYRNDRYLNMSNPAALSALEKHFFSFELSARGQFVSYFGTPLDGNSASNKDFAVKRISVATKITNWWGSGGGLAPFSSANYQFTSVKNIQGTNSTVPVGYEGTGGVNQVYWTNSFEPIKHLSIGVTSAYLFGSLTQSETLTTTDLATSLITTRQAFLKNFRFTYGAQYAVALNKKWDVALGGTFSPTSKLAQDASVTVLDNGVQVANTTNTNLPTSFTLPNASGFGLSISKDKKYTLLADYRYQAWTATNYSGLNYALKNSSRTSLGFEISNKKSYFNNLLFEKNFIQAGVYYGTSYLSVKGEQLTERGFTLGYGLNSKRNLLGICIGLDAGQRGTRSNGLIKENYINLNFTISYRDFWRPRGVRYF
jgi:hypothetical protein